MNPGDPAAFTTIALNELVAVGGGHVGDGIIDIVDPDLESCPGEVEPNGDWHDLAPGRYRVTSIEHDKVTCVYEGPM